MAIKRVSFNGLHVFDNKTTETRIMKNDLEATEKKTFVLKCNIDLMDMNDVIV